MEREWKIGDWVEYKGIRMMVFHVGQEHCQVVDRSGNSDYFSHICIAQGRVKHLYECTGWDWEPVIEPQYRPFLDGAEFAPHRDRWVMDKSKQLFGRCCGYSHTQVYFVNVLGDTYWGNYQRLFGNITFDDGSPFGVEVQL